MKRKVFFSDKAVENLSAIVNYLDENWSKNVRIDFLEQIDRAKSIISKYPDSFQESQIKKGIFKCVISKHNTLFYRVKKNEIEIITIFDTRQNRKKLKRDLR